MIYNSIRFTLLVNRHFHDHWIMPMTVFLPVSYCCINNGIILNCRMPFFVCHTFFDMPMLQAWPLINFTLLRLLSFSPITIPVPWSIIIFTDCRSGWISMPVFSMSVFAYYSGEQRDSQFMQYMRKRYTVTHKIRYIILPLETVRCRVKFQIALSLSISSM